VKPLIGVLPTQRGAGASALNALAGPTSASFHVVLDAGGINGPIHPRLGSDEIFLGDALRSCGGL
jgi:hypothetical protein